MESTMKKAYSHTMRKYMAAAITASLVLFICGLLLIWPGMYIAAAVEQLPQPDGSTLSPVGSTEGQNHAPSGVTPKAPLLPQR